jgi:2-C-methyl-D-erythritol 4-phosphate cytidylyltransferase/2-C-methyl-D-erythritol 2,4-cyclodiphosphate synthase
MYITAIVPAAGVGSRLQDKQTAMPKQFWPLGTRMIIEKVLCELDASPLIKEIIICCAASYKKFIREKIVHKNDLSKVVHIVTGGAMRADTVLKGLKVISPRTTHVLVQDAVRPFIDQNLIRRLAIAAKGCDGVIAARPVSSTIKKVSRKKIRSTVDRSHLWEAETPQLFRKRILLRAYRTLRKEASAYTDEASLVEAIGGTVTVIDSKIFNLKITTRTDYELARRIAEERMVKVGFGYDIHRLVEGRKLIIGGVRIPSTKGPLGHSDGDPLLHALIDAVLGAASLGDIGELFPDTDQKYKGIDSTKLLDQVLVHVSQKGLAIDHIDATIILERPKLSAYKPKIKKKLMSLLSMRSDQINIKAKTKEGLGSEGAGAAVSCYVSVTLTKG